MHSRSLRPRRLPLLALGFAGLIFGSACSEQASDADAGGSAVAAQTTSEKGTQGSPANAAATPDGLVAKVDAAAKAAATVKDEAVAMQDAITKAAAVAKTDAMAKAAGPGLDDFTGGRKSVDDPKADAARKEAFLNDKQGGSASGADQPQYDQALKSLTGALNEGKIDKQQFADEKAKLDQRFRVGGAEPAKPVDPDGAKLVFAQKDFDFGTVWDTAPLEHEFAFENQGGKTLEITRIKPSCGCTTTSLTRTSFEPGEGELIPIVWKPKGIGPQKKTVTISHNNGPDQVLNISATLKQFVALEPTLLRLGDLPQHEAHHAELKLVLADKNFQITRITPSNDYLTATEKSRDAEGNLILDVVIKENAPWGNFNARLEIEGTGVTEPGAEPVTHTVMTQVIAKMYGDIRVEPEQIQLGIVAPNSKFTGEALIYHVDGKEFDLAELSMRFSRPEMQVRSEKTTKDGNPAIKIIVEGDAAGFTERYVRGTIFFKTSLGDADNQQLQIAGSIR
jgi:hypothetical protein